MNDNFEVNLRARLENLRQKQLHRTLTPIESPQGIHLQLRGQSFLNFSSNDYLGLAIHPSLEEAGIAAIRDYGAGSGASRLISGSLAPHTRLEADLAAFKGTEAAITFGSGYAAALGTIPAIVGSGDVVILDRLAHACLVDAARSSGATLRVFAHQDFEDLEIKLRWARERSPGKATVLIVTESVFSMDGDVTLLPKLVELKNRYGAVLMLDEAHSTGIFGPGGRGLAHEAGVADRVEIQMGTLGKALGAAGGFICGSRALVDHLVNHARTFIFSTAPVPAAAAAAAAALRIAQSREGDGLRARLWEHVAELGKKLNFGLTAPKSPIVPVILGDEQETLNTAAELRGRGFYVPAIRYPSVARGKARLRLTLSAAHTVTEVGELASALIETCPSLRHPAPQSCA